MHFTEVSSLAEAVAVVRSVQANGGTQACLKSIPSGALTVGAPYFKEILDRLAADFPEVSVDFILDCGASAGAVMAAIRAGIPKAVFSGPAAAREKLADMGRQCGVEILPERPC
jgi:hypothetical protein